MLKQKCTYFEVKNAPKTVLEKVFFQYFSHLFRFP